jgi:hypothetical protein
LSKQILKLFAAFLSSIQLGWGMYPKNLITANQAECSRKISMQEEMLSKIACGMLHNEIIGNQKLQHSEELRKYLGCIYENYIIS